MSDEIFQHAREFIVKKINPEFIIVFGSYSKALIHNQSDIDIAFYREGESFTSYELFMFAQELADIIKVEVDLIDLKEASTVFATQIFSTGTVIYSKNENLRMEMHMRTYSMYARLNEERQPIIDKIIETGSVYPALTGSKSLHFKSIKISKRMSEGLTARKSPNGSTNNPWGSKNPQGLKFHCLVNDVILNKISMIERCLNRIAIVYANSPDNLTDFTKQDSIVLNIQRACEACIDLAMHISAFNNFGVPQKSREAFDLLFLNNVITEETTSNMKAMVGFRNIAVHDYQTINIDILKEIIENHLTDFTSFTEQILAY